jgi:phosphoadenosine phosphosulfate reductase
VWEFIKDFKIPYCKLYDHGFKRLGCIGCPMSTHKHIELNMYPKYKKAYLRAFKRMLDNRFKKGLKTQWKTPEDVMSWWLSQ